MPAFLSHISKKFKQTEGYLLFVKPLKDDILLFRQNRQAIDGVIAAVKSESTVDLSKFSERQVRKIFRRIGPLHHNLLLLSLKDADSQLLAAKVQIKYGNDEGTILHSIHYVDSIGALEQLLLEPVAKSRKLEVPREDGSIGSYADFIAQVIAVRKKDLADLALLRAREAREKLLPHVS